MANKRDIKAALGTFFEENKIEFYVSNQHLNQWFSNVFDKMNIRKLIEEQRIKRTIKR